MLVAAQRLVHAGRGARLQEPAEGRRPLRLTGSAQRELEGVRARAVRLAVLVQRIAAQASPSPIRPVMPMRCISQPLNIISRISTATLSPHSRLMVTSSRPAPRQVRVPKV